ncbi:MAG: tRNA-dependent cyclodipeptide synthase [Sedimentisphaerales bacterium]|nr:tRNA-dependent cyclodipeptide synthase [Sedimentisphaerales bacterium]
MSVSNSENLNLPSVTIAKILPKIPEEQLYAYKQCYLGISLDNPVFDGDSLYALLLWITDKFEHCLVIVGDHLSRFNERILNDCDWETASKIAYDRGDEFIRKTEQLFQQFPDGKAQLTRWKTHLQTDHYKKAREIIDNLFISNDEFRASIEKDALSFVKRLTRRNHTLAVETAEAINLSSEYLIEEIAVFSSLSEQGWQVELYPGPELRVLVDVARGKYKDTPIGLKQRISVELKLS